MIEFLIGGGDQTTTGKSEALFRTSLGNFSMSSGKLTERKKIPIIYWSKWFDMDQWEGYTIDNCNLSYTCEITHDRSRVTNSSVLIFHASDVNKKNFVFPEQLKHSAWVYHDAEAPHSQSPDIINRMQYSMTYRLDSDFPWGYLQEQELLKVMETPKTQRSSVVKPKAPVAWIVSNCKASNYRHHYVKELMRYIDIDIYGHCMENTEWPASNPNAVNLISGYQFYLALENSNCKDYVTEKLSNAYLAGVVPIVDGPSDYGPFIPNTHSVIRVDDFNSPKELAKYLETLMANKELYNRYLEYKRPGGLSDRFKNTLQAYKNGQCGLCQLAYERHENLEGMYYPGKKIYLDNTCISSKHYSFKHSKALQIYIPLMLLLSVIVFFLLKKTRRFRKWTSVRTSE